MLPEICSSGAVSLVEMVDQLEARGAAAGGSAPGPSSEALVQADGPGQASAAARWGERRRSAEGQQTRMPSLEVMAARTFCKRRTGNRCVPTRRAALKHLPAPVLPVVPFRACLPPRRSRMSCSTSRSVAEAALVEAADMADGQLAGWVASVGVGGAFRCSPKTPRNGHVLEELARRRARPGRTARRRRQRVCDRCLRRPALAARSATRTGFRAGRRTSSARTSCFPEPKRRESPGSPSRFAWRLVRRGTFALNKRPSRPRTELATEIHHLLRRGGASPSRPPGRIRTIWRAPHRTL